MLGHDVPVAQAKVLLTEAAKAALQNPGMAETQKAIICATRSGAEGITYTIKYRVAKGRTES